MRKWTRFSLIAFTALLWAASSAAEEKVDFKPVVDFLKLPKTITLEQCSAAAIDSKGRLYLFHRGKQPIILLDGNGRYLRSWGDDVIRTAHGMRVDSDDNIWVTDIGNHLVLKFNPRGKLLLALGESGKPGDEINRFNKPTDIAFAKNGDVFVTDGYGNSRVMKFNAQGKFLKTWGTAGEGPGEFDLPHSIVIDAKQRVLVGDRENDRVQVFDTQGKLLEIWPGFAPYGMVLDGQGQLFVADGRASAVLQIGQRGKVIGKWGKKGTAVGEFLLPHMLAVDSDGNLYVAEVGGKRFQKLVRRGKVTG